MYKIELSHLKDVNSLIVDFFRKKNTKEISWKEELVVEKLQEELISKTLDSPIVDKFKIDIKYQKRFVRALICYLDKIKADICEAAYKTLIRLSTEVGGPYHYVFYPIFETSELDKLSELNAVVLMENINIISGGTTGLVTWQAGQALAEWALKTKPKLEKKTILELGSGAGMSGLVIASSTSCGRYIFTDCHEDVLTLLKDNVGLNSSMKYSEETYTTDLFFQGEVGSCPVEVRKLDWEANREGLCKKFGHVDSIFAADVVYDKSLFEPLLGTIKTFLQNGTESAIVSFKRRLEETVEKFTEKLDSMDMKIEWLETPEPKYLSWEMHPVIHIISITLKNE